MDDTSPTLPSTSILTHSTTSSSQETCSICRLVLGIRPRPRMSSPSPFRSLVCRSVPPTSSMMSCGGGWATRPHGGRRYRPCWLNNACLTASRPRSNSSSLTGSPNCGTPSPSSPRPTCIPRGQSTLPPCNLERANSSEWMQPSNPMTSYMSTPTRRYVTSMPRACSSMYHRDARIDLDPAALPVIEHLCTQTRFRANDATGWAGTHHWDDIAKLFTALVHVGVLSKTARALPG